MRTEHGDSSHFSSDTRIRRKLESFFVCLSYFQIKGGINLKNSYFIIIVSTYTVQRYTLQFSNMSLLKNRVFTLYIIQAQCRDLLERKPGFLE